MASKKNTNPDRHGNTWEDRGVYLCEIAWNQGNPIHLVVVEARVVGPDGWCSSLDRPHGEVDLVIWNPSYEYDLRHQRMNPSAVYFLRTVRQLDFTFEGKGVGSAIFGKTPESAL